MSGVAVTLRQRTRDTRRPHIKRHTKAESAVHLRDAALSLLRLPGIDDEARATAGRCLDHAGDLLTAPRCGWYPRRPAGWRP